MGHEGGLESALELTFVPEREEDDYEEVDGEEEEEEEESYVGESVYSEGMQA